MEPMIGDALGMAIAAHFEGSSGSHVLERDDGWVDVGDSAVYFREPTDWPAGEPVALTHVRGSVLDIGAGAGRYALELEKAGHEILALDTSEGAVDVCRRRGVAEGFVGTIYDLDLELRFDTFLLGGQNLGLLESPAVAPMFLDRLRSLAYPGARIVGTSRDPQTMTDSDQIVAREFNLSRDRREGQFRFRVRRGRLATPWFDYWYLSPDELDVVSARSGWRITHTELLDFGGYLAVLELDDR